MGGTLVVLKKVLLAGVSVLIPLAWLSLFMDGLIHEKATWISLVFSIGGILLILFAQENYRWISYLFISLLGLGTISIYSETPVWMPQVLALSLALFSVLYLQYVYPSILTTAMSSLIFLLIGLVPLSLVINLVELPNLILLIFFAAILITSILVMTVNERSSETSAVAFTFFSCQHLVIRASMIFVGSTMLDSTIRQHVALYGDPLIAGFAGFTLLWGVFVGNRLAWPFFVKTISTLFIIQAVIYDNFFVHLLLVLATVADIAFTLSASPQRPKDHLQADPLSMGAIGGSVSFILILACLDLAGHLSAIYLLFWLIVISLVSAVLWTRSFVGQVAMLDKRTEPLGLAMHAGFYIVAIGILFMRAI